MKSRRLFFAEVRVRPARVLGAALACTVTAAVAGACGLLLMAVERSPTAAWASGGQSRQDVESLLSLLVSLVTISAVMVLGTTVSLWTGQRLHQFAVLRALGTTVGRVRMLVTTDVLWLAAASGLLGSVAGAVPLAWGARRFLADRDLMPATVPLPDAATTLLTLATVCAALCCVAVVAGLGSIHAAGRVSPTAALRSRGASGALRRSRVRLVLGLAMVLTTCLPLLIMILVGGGPPMQRAAMTTGLTLLLIPSLAVLAPWTVPVLSLPFTALLRLADRRLGKVAASGLRSAPARTTAIAVPVLLAVGFSTCLLGTDANIAAAVSDQASHALRATAVVSAKEGTRLPATPASAPGVHATAVLGTQVTVARPGKAAKSQRAWGVDGAALGEALDLGVGRGSLDSLSEGTFAAGITLADSRGWHLGDRVELTLADGRSRSLRLTAVYERDLAFPALLLPRSSVPAQARDTAADRYLLTGRSDAWPAAPGQQVRSRSEYLAGLAPRSAADSLATYLMVAVVTGYALMSAANTCALAQRDRVAERAHLRAIGLSRFQLTRLVALETLTAAAVGAVLATVVVLVCLAPLSSRLGQGVLPAVNWPWAAGVGCATVLLTAVPALVAAHPLRRADRQFAGAAS